MAQPDTLRTLIQAPELLVMPGIFDGFSARLVEQAGFAAGFISGGGLSETLLGYSDVGLMGFELNLAAVTRLAACCTLPLLADADTGYGNAVNVYHTTRAFEQAGVAGLMIEDQTWPKRCGHMQGKEVIPAEEMVEKIHAACDARRDPAFVVHGPHRCLRDPWAARSAASPHAVRGGRGRPPLRRRTRVGARYRGRGAARPQAPLCEYGLRDSHAGHDAPDPPGAVAGAGRGGGDLSAPADGVCHPGDAARDRGVA